MIRLFVLALFVFALTCTSQAAPSYPASIDSKTCANSLEFYPRTSHQLKETGTVVLRFVVEVNGSLSSVDVEESSGYRRLDQAARKLLETCKFKPGMVNGKLEKSSGTLRVKWELDRGVLLAAKPARSLLPPCPESGRRDQCFGSRAYENGSYEGEWKDDKANGFGKVVLTRDRSDGTGVEQYEGDFVNGMFHGFGRFTFVDGRITDCP